MATHHVASAASSDARADEVESWVADARRWLVDGVDGWEGCDVVDAVRVAHQLRILMDDIGRVVAGLETSAAARFEDRVVVPGVGMVGRTRSVKHVWDDGPLARLLVVGAVRAAGLDVDDVVVAAVANAVVACAALGWRVRELEARGFDVGEWRDTVRGGWTVAYPSGSAQRRTR